MKNYHPRRFSLDAVVDTIAHNHVKPASLTKEGIVAGGGGGDARGRLARSGNTPPFPQSRPTAAHLRAGASLAGSR